MKVRYTHVNWMFLFDAKGPIPKLHHSKRNQRDPTWLSSHYEKECPCFDLGYWNHELFWNCSLFSSSFSLAFPFRLRGLDMKKEVKNRVEYVLENSIYISSLERLWWTSKLVDTNRLLLNSHLNWQIFHTPNKELSRQSVSSESKLNNRKHIGQLKVQLSNSPAKIYFLHGLQHEPFERTPLILTRSFRFNSIR